MRIAHIPESVIADGFEKSSDRSVRTHRSAKAFALGVRGGIRIAAIHDPASTPSSGLLITVVGDHKSPHDIDSILGFLLGVMGDVTADLVLPRGKESTTLRRLPFLTYPIRVWTHTDGNVTERIIPTRREVLSYYDARSCSSTTTLEMARTG